MAKIKNLLKESIIQVQKLKQASTINTKDRLLKNITQSLKRKLNQQEQNIMDDQEEEISIDDDDTEECNECDQYDIDGKERLGQDQEMLNDQEDDSELDNLVNDQAITEDQQISPTEDDQELDDIIEQLDSEQEEPAYTQQVSDEVFQEGQQNLQGEDIPIETDEDEELMQRIRQILESQESEQEAPEEQKELPASDAAMQVIERLKKENRVLRNQNKAYKENLQTIKKEMNQAKCVQMKGTYALKLFEKYNLTKPQKMTIIENFDRARNERQIKLIYATLSEGLKSVNKINTKQSPSRGVASNKMNSTKTKIKENLDNNLDGTDIPIYDIFKRKINL